VSETNSEENGSKDWTTIKVPKALMERVEALLRARGYVSRSEYVRAAIITQLASDEGKDD
jgi:metal-responsive CopG/Arc/MetJ family transcriptional regulator